MSADIEQGIDFIFRAAHDDHRFPIELEQEPVPDFRDFALVTGVDPGI